MPRNAVSWGLGLLGAAAGGVVGWYVFDYLYKQGIYGMMLPGGLLGVGCGALSRHESIARGALCGLAGLALGLYIEWEYVHPGPRTLPGFVEHLQKAPLFLLMIIGGAVLAFWFGRGQLRLTRPPPDTPKA